MRQMRANDPGVAIDHRLLKALGHPLRQRLLRALNERVASPSELAEELGERLGNVSYHVKMLAEYDAIELVKTAPVRGALEHFYRATLRPHLDDEHWAELPPSVRRALFDQTLQQIWDHLAAAAAHGGLDDLKTHVSWTTLELDDQAYEELTDHLAAMLDRAMELHAEAAARLAELAPEEHDGHRTELAILHFHRAVGERPPRRGRLRAGSRKRRPTKTG